MNVYLQIQSGSAVFCRAAACKLHHTILAGKGVRKTHGNVGIAFPAVEPSGSQFFVPGIQQAALCRQHIL